MIGQVRGWGFSFIVVAIAGVTLPSPLGWYALVVLVVLFVICVVTEYADRRVQAAVVAAAETDEHLVWTAELKRMAEAEEAEWEQFLGSVPTDGAPLGTRTWEPANLRVIRGGRVPMQRVTNGEDLLGGGPR